MENATAQSAPRERASTMTGATAVTEAIAFVEKNHRSYPHEFSYEETVQTLTPELCTQPVASPAFDAV